MIAPRCFCRFLVFALCWPSTMELNSAHAAQKSAKPTIKIRISQSAVGARSTILWSAQELGLFAKHGVEAEVVYLRTSPIQMTALSTGEVQFAVTGGSPVLSAAAGGQDVKIISSPSNRLSYDLVVRPEIKEVKELRGKRFGVTSMGGTVWMAAYLTLEYLGLDANRDQIHINAIGNQTILAQAIESAQIDATLLDPFLSRRTKLKGLPVLVELQRAKIPFTNSAWAVNGSFLREHPETIEAVLKAMIEAQAFIAAPANRNGVLRTMARQMKVNDMALLEEGYQDLLVGLERKPYATLEGLRNIQRMMSTFNAKANRARIEEIIDNRIVRKLDESGFIDSFYVKN
ncbi:MAG TPA: NrtA/SsuA/CpmA family ABC transporter substrate-binding protein [Verrucomicrobiae bacterium]|nr:NrtA/SsuA/CpmA family ABC transporter substrate-binding protein [Verrucomicrobiae bacterium]